MSRNNRHDQPVTFFIDACLGSKIVPEAMRSAGAKVEILLDHFPGDCSDVEWITDVSQRGWVVITKDLKMSDNPLELAAIVSANARVFIVPGELTGKEGGEALGKAVEGMRKFAQAKESPFIARVDPAGRVRMWRNRAKLGKFLRCSIGP